MDDNEIPGAPTPRATREELLYMFRCDFECSTWSPTARVGCLRDWRRSHPELTADLYVIADSIDPMVRVSIGQDGVAPPPEPAPLRLVHSGEPISKASSPPIFVAVLVCVFALILIECVLIALKVGGAIPWDWGWVLAPLLLPTVIAMIVIILTAIALAALDERDAARRRSS